MKKSYRWILLASLVLPALACGLFNPMSDLNNQIRLAVFEYEEQRYGPVDELILHFNRGEPRVRFDAQHQQGGRTVWLDPLGAEEYLGHVRSPQATYLYIQAIDYNPRRTGATVDVYRGDGYGYQGWELSLARQENDRWVVTDEVKINE